MAAPVGLVVATAAPLGAMFAALALQGIASDESATIEKSSEDLKHEQEVAKAQRKADFMKKRQGELKGENDAQSKAAEEAFNALEQAQALKDAKALKELQDAEQEAKTARELKEAAAAEKARAAAEADEEKKKAKAKADKEASDKLAEAATDLEAKKKSFLKDVTTALNSRDGSLIELVKFATANPDVVKSKFIDDFAKLVQEAVEDDRLSSLTQIAKEILSPKDREKRLAATEKSQLNSAQSAMSEAAAAAAAAGGKLPRNYTRRRQHGGVVMTSEVSALIKLALYENPNQYSVCQGFKRIVTINRASDNATTEARITEFLRGPFTEFINFRDNFLKSTDVSKRNCAITMFDEALKEENKEKFRVELFVNRAAVINSWGTAVLIRFPTLEDKLTERAKTLKWASNINNWLDIIHNALDKAEKSLSDASKDAEEMTNEQQARASIEAAAHDFSAAAAKVEEESKNALALMRNEKNEAAGDQLPRSLPVSVAKQLEEENAELDSAAAEAAKAKVPRIVPNPLYKPSPGSINDLPANVDQAFGTEGPNSGLRTHFGGARRRKLRKSTFRRHRKH
jgi:hypothetical protein